LFITELRVSELTNLNRDQFSESALLNSKTKELEVVIIGKGGFQRVVYVSERSANWLIKYMRLCKSDTQALFTNLANNKTKTARLTPRSIELIIKRYVRLCGLPSTTTPHTIRHSYATDLLEQGADLRTIQEFLGHKNIVTTQVYTHVTNRQLRDVHKAFHSGKNLKN
jgi:site-specific recombinase XerD